MNFKALAKWYAVKGAWYPWRRTTDPFRIMLTEIMLQRTRAENVAEVYPVFFARFPSPKRIAEARLTTLASALAPLGLKHRVPRIRELGKALSAAKQMPGTRESLLELPGVGPYVADAVLCYSLRLPVIPVDVNIQRLFARYYASRDAGHCAAAVLREYGSEHQGSFDIRSLNWAFLDLSKMVCTARKPKCAECPLAVGCRSDAQHRPITCSRRGTSKPFLKSTPSRERPQR